MANTFIAGYEVTFTLGSDDVSGNIESGGLTLNRNVMTKYVGGEEAPPALAGTLTGSISLSGHVSTEDVAKFQTFLATSAGLSFTLQVGDATAPDAGAYSGTFICDTYSVNWDANDEWAFTVSGITSGAVTYTAAI